MKYEKQIWGIITAMAILSYVFVREPGILIIGMGSIIMVRIVLMEEDIIEKINSRGKSSASGSKAARKPFEMGVDPSPNSEFRLPKLK